MRVRVRKHYHTGGGNRLRKCWHCGLNLLESEAIKDGGRFFHDWCYDDTLPGEGQEKSTGIDNNGTGVGLCTLTYVTTFGDRDNFFTQIDGLDFFKRR